MVISDRFTDSSLVYQGMVHGLGPEVVYEVDRIACRGLVPDVTFVVDVDTETGLARAHHRNVRTENVETRLNEHPVTFHRKARKRFCG